LPGKSPLEVHVNDLADVDALLLLGGGYLNSWHVKASSYLYAISADAAADLNKPVFGTGLNLGPFNSIDSRRLSRTLRRFDLIGVRDRRESFAWLHAHGFLDPAIHRFSQDDAIGLVPTSEGREDLELLVAHLHPYIALQAHFWRLDETASDRLLATLADAAEQLVRRSGLRVLLIPMTFGNRARSDRDVLSHLPIDEGLKEHIVMAPDGLSPQQLKYLFANASGAIVTRHHGMMFALSAGVRCQAIILDPYYRQKLEGVAADFGELCTLLPLASLSSSALVNPWLGRGNWKSA
jgi:polysaccharide pyruvyl transferase WcaK-like protein